MSEKFIWCPVANVIKEYSVNSALKHFSPGTKLYCFPLLWGDGGDRLRVLGHHRNGGPRLIDIVVKTRYLTNWRIQKTFHPHVVNIMKGYWGNSEEDMEKVLLFVDSFVNPKSPRGE